MEWNLFDAWIDVPLYGQMKYLIYEMCKKEDRYTLLTENDRSDLFTDQPKKGMDEAYHLSYPGEALERLGERMEVTERQQRALALALARTKSLQEERMFVGNQLPNFLGKLKRQLHGDKLFMLGFQCLMDGTERKEAYEGLLGYPYRELREILFALSILPEDDQLWQAVCQKLNALLGNERDISVFENAGVYVWLARQVCFHQRMRVYRKKDMDVLKYVLRLPFLNVLGKQDTVLKKLTGNGYAVEELSYLNSLMIREVRFPDSIFPGSITGEKIAVETCRRFLGSDKVYPRQAYELCSCLCEAYKEFRIKLNGNQGILDALIGQVKVKTPEAFRTLYPYISGKPKFAQWKIFDLTDPKWDGLHTWLPETEYEECVTESLLAEEEADKLARALKRYQELTGKDYTEQFWKTSVYKISQVFRHLADLDALPAEALMEAFLKEYQEKDGEFENKWKNMAWYLQEYAKKIHSHKAFQVLKLYVERLGVVDIPKLFSFGEIVKSCFMIRYRNCYADAEKLDIVRPFLTEQEHQQLFYWIEEYQFRHNTEKYLKFLGDTLLNEETRSWLPWEDAREIYFALRKSKMAAETEHRLRELYLTEPEQTALRQKEEEENRRKKGKEKWERVKKIKKEFTKVVAKNRLKQGLFKRISDFLAVSYYYRKETAEIAAGYLKDAKTGICLFDDEDLAELMKLLIQLHRYGEMDLETLKQCIGKAEVKECEKECREESEKESVHA